MEAGRWAEVLPFFYAALSDWYEVEGGRLPAHLDQRLRDCLTEAWGMSLLLAEAFPFWKSSPYQEQVLYTLETCLEQPLSPAWEQVLLDWYDWLALAERLLRFWQRLGLPWWDERPCLSLEIADGQSLALYAEAELDPLIKTVWEEDFRRFCSDEPEPEAEAGWPPLRLRRPARQAQIQGNYRQAEAWILHLMREFPAWTATGFRRLGDLYLSQKQVRQALDAYAKAWFLGYRAGQIRQKIRKTALYLAQKARHYVTKRRWLRYAKQFD